MANPKRRHSNARTRSRRTHDFVQPRPVSVCPQCGKSVPPHRICQNCGHYRGRQVVTIAAKSEKETGSER